ncbi:Hypothetical protein, putative, partial [Bodo saltans]
MKSLRQLLVVGDEQSRRTESPINKSFRRLRRQSGSQAASSEDLLQRQASKPQSINFDMSVGKSSSSLNNKRRQGGGHHLQEPPGVSDLVEEFTSNPLGSVKDAHAALLDNCTASGGTDDDRKFLSPLDEIPPLQHEHEPSSTVPTTALGSSRRDQMWMSIKMDRSSHVAPSALADTSHGGGGGDGVGTGGDGWVEEDAHQANPLLPPSLARHKSVVSVAPSVMSRNASRLFRMAEGLDAAIEGVEDALQSF